MPCPHCLGTRLKPLSKSPSSPPGPRVSTPQPSALTLPSSLSGVCLFGIGARYFPSQSVSQSVCLPAPRRLRPLDEQPSPPPLRAAPLPSSHPATLTPSHPHPALPMNVAKQLPATRSWCRLQPIRSAQQLF